jgi:hypothetical protein
VLTSDVWVPINMVGELSPRGSASLLKGRGIRVARDGRPLEAGLSAFVRPARSWRISDARFEQEFPGREPRQRRPRSSASSPIPGNGAPVAAFLAVLMGLVGLVLAIACANRGLVCCWPARARAAREIAVRLAIGAGRGRLIRQMLVESMMLFLLEVPQGSGDRASDDHASWCR